MTKTEPPTDSIRRDQDLPDQSLDVTGLKCPLPVLKARKALSGMAAGTVLEVLATDPAATLDFRHFSKQSGHELLLSEAEGEVLRFLLRRAG
ncbi:MAG: sulfurtransferase TusA family protein [Alphaproteobacteria bacterium]|nr:sulfurtransferase TusA family protein [Alphaproteobacteria bacterium]